VTIRGDKFLVFCFVVFWRVAAPGIAGAGEYCQSREPVPLKHYDATWMDEKIVPPNLSKIFVTFFLDSIYVRLGVQNPM
jgi:hypothetical protein